MPRISIDTIYEVGRYYMAGAANAAFGYSIFALLLWAGINMYLAQIIAHIIGVIFNYFTYSRHVFRTESSARIRFVISYVANYGISLIFLALAIMVVKSPYIAGLISIILTSVVNYFILKRLVFVRNEAA